jgi:DNA (cytosine-5)-methyltransferase 1
LRKLKLLDLFSGIGGFSLGLERSGAFQTVAFCEIEPYCQKIIKKHWPEVPLYEDVTTLSKSRLAEDGITIDAICGGFPCQDISEAGKGAGLEGERSGLWFEYSRLIGEIRPQYVIIENVSELLIRGFEHILSSLAQIGYDAEWHCIQAADVGAPHIRDRVWIIAYPSSVRQQQLNKDEEQGATAKEFYGRSRFFKRTIKPKREIWGANESYIPRVAYGVPNRSHRMKALGNAVVPQIPEIIGQAIKEFEENK